MSFVKISWSAATNCGTRRAEDKAQTGSYSLRKLGSESDASDEVDPWGDRSMVCLFGWVGSPRLIFQKKNVEFWLKYDTMKINEIMGESYMANPKDKA